MSASVGSKRANPYKRRVLSSVEETAPYTRLKVAGEMGALAVQAARQALVPPFPWIREAVLQGSLAFRRCAIPLLLAHSVYLIGFGIILFGGIMTNLGLTERVSGTMFIIWSREIATWISAMIFAGIVGSAITADLGARKIREELDALSVLGVKQTRALVVPRVVACTIAMPALAMISLLLINLVNYGIAPRHFGFSHEIFLDSVRSNIEPKDLYFTMFLKNLVIGFYVGVVACYKGLASRGGAEGVGRAVNETVVVAFFGIWMFNSLFNLGYFTVFPDVSVFKG